MNPPPHLIGRIRVAKASGDHRPLGNRPAGILPPKPLQTRPMITVIVTIHLILAVAVIGVVLLQKSEGGALGMGGGGMSGFMTGRSTANLLTRVTAALAAAFMMTSVLLVVLHNRAHSPPSVIEQGPSVPPPASLPNVPQPAEPAAPS